jgi:glyoxylase-like metal-dependent hydrolase (beta-lactamase superfamily II)
LEFETQFAQTMQACSDPLATLRAMGRDIDESSAARAWEIKELQQTYPVKSLVGNFAQLEFFEDDPIIPGNLSLMRVPGHSIDSRAIVIKGQGQQAAVTGDAFYHRDLWKVCVLGINYDDNLFQKNAERLSRFKGIIIPGHDHAFDNYSRKYLTEDSLKL